MREDAFDRNIIEEMNTGELENFWCEEDSTIYDSFETQPVDMPPPEVDDVLAAVKSWRNDEMLFAALRRNGIFGDKEN